MLLCVGGNITVAFSEQHFLPRSSKQPSFQDTCCYCYWRGCEELKSKQISETEPQSKCLPHKDQALAFFDKGFVRSPLGSCWMFIIRKYTLSVACWVSELTTNQFHVSMWFFFPRWSHPSPPSSSAKRAVCTL